MGRLIDQTVADLLEDVASATPAPGGGSSSALACALAAALVEMAAGIGGADTERVRALRARVCELAEQELSAYAPVLEALRLPREDSERAPRIDAALVEASRSPLEIAELAADVAELGSQVVGASSPSVRGDAVTGVVLAEAACAAAATLVEINLADVPSSELAERARSARSRAWAERDHSPPS